MPKYSSRNETVQTGFKQEKNSETGEKTTSANVQVADLKLAG